MAPVHLTDVDHERWSQAEWQHYELWEKLELKMRRRNRLWVAATVVVFLMISSIPVVMERGPKWRSMSAARSLAREMNLLKREAAIDRAAYRIAFQPGTLKFRVEKLTSCADAQGTLVREGQLLSSEELSTQFTMVDPSLGTQLGVPGLVDRFCYDPLVGNELVTRGVELAGMGIAPVKDLSENRIDRASVLLLEGPSAELSF